MATTLRSTARWSETTGLNLISPAVPRRLNLLAPVGRVFKSRGPAKKGLPLGEFVNEFTILSLIPSKSNLTFTHAKVKTQQGNTMELRISHNTRYLVPENQK